MIIRTTYIVTQSDRDGPGYVIMMYLNDTLVGTSRYEEGEHHPHHPPDG